MDESATDPAVFFLVRHQAPGRDSGAEEQDLDDRDREPVQDDAPSAGPLVVSASSIPYIDASRAPSPDGTNTASTATIAPTADTPPRNGSVARPGSLPTERSRKYRPRAADHPRAAVEEEQQVASSETAAARSRPRRTA